MLSARVGRLVTLLGLVGALYPGAASATTYTVTPAADATVSSSAPTVNYGKSTALTALFGSTMNVAYLRFAVPELDAPVVSASLQLNPKTAVDLSVRAVSDTAWGETAITWVNAPALGLLPVESGYAAPGAYARLDVTALVATSGPTSLVMGGAVGFGLTTTQASAMTVASRETSTPPKLVIETTGLPIATPPVNVAAPALSGTARSGTALQASRGTWLGSTPRTYAYQWRRCDSLGLICSSVPGATSSTYRLSSGDVGSRIRVRVTASNAAGSLSADSAITASVAAAPPGSYYVSTAGNDSSDGSAAAPWRTVGRAAEVVAAGSTVILRRGSYPENVTLAASGSAAAPITFRNNATDVVTLRSLTLAAGHLVVSGLGISGATRDCVTVAPALTDITLQSGRISNCARDGVRFTRSTTQPYTRDVTIKDNRIFSVGRSNTAGNGLTIYADDITVQGNDITGTPNDAINMWGDRHTYRQNAIHDLSNTVGNHNDAFQTWGGLGDGAEGNPVTNLVIERNVIRHVLGQDAHVLFAEGPGHRDWTIRSNLIWKIGDQALILGKPGIDAEGITNVLLHNNTFVSAGTNNTIELNLTTSATLVNNIFYDCAGWDRAPYYKARTATLTADHNLAGGSTGSLSEPNGENGDPRFVNPASNFRLLSTSPAIDAGDDGNIVSPVRTSDLYGSPTRDAPDIGAVEYQG